MTQPPLSQAIHKLECELGVRLFARTTRSVTPTEAGRAFAENARNVLGLLDAAVAGARQAGGHGSAVRMGCLPYFPLERIQLLIRTLGEREPGVETEVVHLLSHEQVRLLHDGRLDLGVVYDVGDLGDLELEPLFPGDPLHAVLPVDHPLASKPVLRPRDVRREELVLFSRWRDPAVYDRVLAAIEEAGYRFHRVHEAPGVTRRDVLLAAAQGLGVAVGPFSHQDVPAATNLTRRPLEPTPAMPETALAWSVRPPRHLHAFLAAARSAARELHTTEALGHADGSGPGSREPLADGSSSPVRSRRGSRGARGPTG